MSTPQAFASIEIRFRAEWGDTTPLYFENEDPNLPDAPAHFLFVEVAGDFFDQASIGGGETVTDNLWREDGQIVIHVMTLRGIGSLAARQLARQAIDIFRGLDLDGIRYRATSVGAGEPGEADGNYWRFTATIDFERDE